jgi:hypothetical protein
MTQNKNNEAITEAIELLVDKGIDLLNALQEERLLKQLTNVSFLIIVYPLKIHRLVYSIIVDIEYCL